MDTVADGVSPATKPKAKRPPEKAKFPPHFYAEEGPWQEKYLKKYPPPPADQWNTDEGSKKLHEELNADLLKADEIPSSWKLARPARHNDTDTAYRRRLNLTTEWQGQKREKGQGNEDFVKGYTGLRRVDFSTYHDGKDRARWVISLKDFPGIPGSSTTKTAKMAENSELELFVEPSPAFLEKVGEFTARTYNYTATELFATFRGLVPDLLILHKLRSSNAKRNSTAAQKKAKESGVSANPAEDRDTVAGSLAAAPMVQIFSAQFMAEVARQTKEMHECLDALAVDVGKDADWLFDPLAAEPRTAWEAMFRCVYTPHTVDGAFDTAQVDKRRKYLQSQIEKLKTEAAAADDDKLLQLFLGMLSGDGDWKEKMSIGGGDVKYIASQIRDPFGRLAIIAGFEAMEAAGSHFNAEQKKKAAEFVVTVRTQSQRVTGIEAKIAEMRTRGAEAEVANNEKFQAVMAERAELIETVKQLKEEGKKDKKKSKKSKKSSDSESSSEEEEEKKGKKKSKKHKKEKKSKDDSSSSSSEEEEKPKKKKKKQRAESEDDDDAKTNGTPVAKKTKTEPVVTPSKKVVAEVKKVVPVAMEEEEFA